MSLALVLLAPVAHAACGGFDGLVGRYDWCVDGSITGGTVVAGSLVSAFVQPPLQQRLLFDARSTEETVLLHAGLANDSDWLSPRGFLAGTGVPFTVAALGASMGVGAAFGTAGSFDLRGGVAGGLAWGEAVGLSVVATDLLQSAIGRPRPYTSEAFEAAFPELSGPLRTSPRAYRSLPEGHSSATAAALFAPATLWALAEVRHGPTWRWLGPAAAYGLATGLTGAVGTMRVRSGLHHREDVYAGAMLGATLGVAVPLAHALPAPETRLRLSSTGSTLVVSGRL